MPDSPSSPLHAQALNGRVSEAHLRLRLGIERDHEAQIFGQGRSFFHPENWYSLRKILRTGLRLCGLSRRSQRNVLDIAIRHHVLPIPGLPVPFHDFAILHLSDLHLDMHPDLPAALSQRVRQVEYDLVVMTGDFRGSTFGPYERALQGMAHVYQHFKAPVYGVLGNHDSLYMVPPLEALGMRLLLNEAVVIERGGERMYLAGIDDPHYYRADNLEKACETIPTAAISMLLCHSPEMYRHAAHAGFDVMLCGHTHGGQLCLPGGFALTYLTNCPRRYCVGAWQYQQMQGYTSVGAGVSIVAARLHCQPEITVHHLRSV